ncbi:hypothetical protein M0804_013238 [Polistes exclamans]|nr:hypothetical protein M0804_013238 [Polistes exclamans]
MFEVPDDKMKELFLTLVHEDFHAQIQLCFSYVNFSKISYEQIIEYYFHYFKSPNEDPHRRRFLCRNQYEQESTENYANSLRKICNKYNFQQPVENKLCKKFINGIHDEEIRTQLKKLSFLSFDEIVQFASDVKDSKEIITYLTEALSMINIYHLEKDNLHRSRISCRDQYEKETLEEYAYNLRKIYNKCIDRNRLEKKLCDQFINGIYDDDIRNHLSKIPDLSFDEMVVEAVQFEKGNLIPYYINRALSMIRTYNPEREGDFCCWLNKFEYVANFIRVPNVKMVKFFYKMVDYDVHLNVKEAFPFIDFFELSYEEVINNYFFYFTLSTETCLYRSRFVCREQYEKETIKKFADSLRAIYEKCKYSVPKNKKLCEVFINGILDEKIKIYLKRTPQLLFDEMVAKAIEFENTNEIIHYLNPEIPMIHVYNPEKEGMFYLWLNKFEYVVDVVGVPNYLMVQLFCNMVDNNVHRNVKMGFPSVHFYKLSYDKIINHYLRFFAPSDEIYLHRKRFYGRHQYEQETIENYANHLQKIYNKCNYTCRTDERLCDQFIRGISDDDIRNHLNQIHGLSFCEIVIEAIAIAKEINFSQSEDKNLKLTTGP